MVTFNARSFVRRWRVFGVVALIAVAALLGIATFSGQSGTASRSSRILGDLAADVNLQSAREWRAIAEGALSPELQAEVEEGWGEIESALGALQAATPENTVPLEDLGGLVARYRSAMSDELDLIAADQLAEARAVDEARVDPAFGELHAQIDDLKTRFAAFAEQQRAFALGGALATLLLAVGAIGILVLRDAGRRATEESEARFRALSQNASDVTTVVDQAGTMRYVTASVARVLGYRPEDVLGRPFADLVHPEDRQALSDELSAPAGRTRRPVLTRLLHRDGSWPACETLVANLLAEPAIRGIVLTTRDVTERENLRLELAHRATHDDLTGLPNRALFADRLQHALARRPETDLLDRAVLFLDLDGFKTVNDSLGHLAGDEVLRAVADRLLACLRAADTVARLGGDEFAVVLEDVRGLPQVEEVADRILEAVARPIPVSGQEMQLTASLGIAIARPDVSPEDLLREADNAMYLAKRRGGGLRAHLE